MSRRSQTLLLIVLSFVIFPIGVILFFTHRDKQEAQLFGIVAIIGFLFYVFVWIPFVI